MSHEEPTYTVTRNGAAASRVPRHVMAGDTKSSGSSGLWVTDKKVRANILGNGDVYKWSVKADIVFIKYTFFEHVIFLV